jgi:hypothetical protein
VQGRKTLYRKKKKKKAGWKPIQKKYKARKKRGQKIVEINYCNS